MAIEKGLYALPEGMEEMSEAEQGLSLIHI